VAEDLGERTEDPTARRLRQARDRGQVPKSQDLTSAVTMLAAVIVFVGLGGVSLQRGSSFMTRFLAGEVEGDQFATSSIGQAVSYVAREGAYIITPILLFVFVIVLASQIAQVGWLFTTYPIKPRLSKLNPVAGVQKLFNKRNLVKSVVNSGKLAVVIIICVIVIGSNVGEIVRLPYLGFRQAFYAMGLLVLELSVWLLVLLLVLAFIDLLFQRWQHRQDLKMTKHEVKDERKDVEGDPQVRGRRLRMAMEIAMQRARHEVPDADVIVTNPTHYSVAIRYAPETMNAPRVVASGVDQMALRIREIAIAHGVPLVERPPLARALFYGVPPGQEIPPQHYEAVAEILAYVYRLSGVSPVGAAS